MPSKDTVLTKQEKQWILDRHVVRETDHNEVQIYPMGAERFLFAVLNGSKKNHYTIQSDIKRKDVLVIPGHGNSSFLFAQAGAKSVTVYDKDPVTIAWIKTFKKYYHYRKANDYPTIGELLHALTLWYPPVITLPYGKYRKALLWILHPNGLRRMYIHYLVSLARSALLSQISDQFELESDMQFHTGTIENLMACREKPQFDTAFVPYLLGVHNGIEQEKSIVNFFKQLLELVPNGHILVNPSRNTKEFYLAGTRYFETTGLETIQSIKGLTPYFREEDTNWFRTQGLAVFSAKSFDLQLK